MATDTTRALQRPGDKTSHADITAWRKFPRLMADLFFFPAYCALEFTRNVIIDDQIVVIICISLDF